MEGISGSAMLALEMPQDAIHHPWLSYNGDNLHLGATGTEHGVDFENLAQQASPRAASFPDKLGILVILAGMCGTAGEFLRHSGRHSGAVAVSPIRASRMLAWIWNVRDDPVNPFQRIEGDGGDAGARIGGSLHGEAPIRLFFERVHGQARTGDVSGLGFERLCLAGIDGRSSKRRKAGMSPGEEVAHEGLGKTFGLVKTLQKEAAEELHDSRGIQRRQRQELPFGREHAIRNQGVGMGIPISPIGPERLQRDDAAGGRTSVRPKSAWKDFRIAA